MARNRRVEIMIDAWNADLGKTFNKVFYCSNIAIAKATAEAFMEELMGQYCYDEWYVGSIEEIN